MTKRSQVQKKKRGVGCKQGHEKCRNAGVYGTGWRDECQHDLHPDFR